MKRNLVVAAMVLTASLLWSNGAGDKASKEDPNELVTLSAFAMQSSSGAYGISEDWFARILKDELNVQIEFYTAGDQTEQKFQALMAGGELPDIIGFKQKMYADSAIEAGMLLNLDEHKGELPNLFDNEHFTNAVNYSRDERSMGMGNLYIIPTLIGPAGAVTSGNWKPQLLWDVYQDIGMPPVRTMDDYLSVLKKMQEAYPVNDNGEKVYGMSIFSDWDSLNMQQISTLSFNYGWDSSYASHLTEANVTTGEIRSMLSEDSLYKKNLKFYFKANQMGLLDPDSITQNFDTVQKKLTSGRILFTYYSWLTGSYNSVSSGHVNADDPNGFDFVPAADMKIYDAPDQTIGRDWSYGISSSTKYPKHALALINYLCDMDTQKLIFNGPEGVLWENDSKGIPYVTDAGWSIIESSGEMPLPGGGTLTDPLLNWNSLFYSRTTVDPATGITLDYSAWPSTISRKPTKLQKEWQEWSGYETQIAMMKGEGMIAPATQAVSMVAPPTGDLLMQMNQIGDLVKTYSWRMIFSKDEAEFNSLWKEMTTKADSLGMQDLFKYYKTGWQNALDMVAKYTK